MTDPLNIRAIDLPPELEPVTGLPHAAAFSVRGGGEWVRQALVGHRTLHRAAARHPDARRLEGRGPVYVVPGPGGRVVVRHYHRGGAAAGPLLGDRYLRWGISRPVAEARASAAVRRRGIPSPAVVAGAVHPAGLFYRADLVTMYVPGSIDLAGLLFGEPAEPETSRRRGRSGDEVDRRWLRARVLAETGRLLARMGEAGVEHRDLNAGNVLVRMDGTALRLLLLDLDRCRIRPPGEMTDPVPMLRRLERSLVKLGRRSGRPLAEKEMELLSTSVESKSGTERSEAP